MGKIVKLGMLFDIDNAPDFGDIEMDRNGQLILTHESISKLRSSLTRAVCGSVFSIKPGTQAYVVDTRETLVYHTDDWHFIKSQRMGDKYGTLTVCIFDADDNGYILGDGEKVVFDVISIGHGPTVGQREVVISKTLKRMHYCGNGVYAYMLDLEDAGKIAAIEKPLIDTDIHVYDGDTDITSSMQVKTTVVDEWYDLHEIYDTGV